MRQFLFRRRSTSYTCYHFAAELWAHLHDTPTAGCIKDIRSLHKICNPDPVCIVLFKQSYENPHCGVLLHDGYLAHMDAKYSVIVPFETVACNYNSISFFK